MFQHSAILSGAVPALAGAILFASPASALKVHEAIIEAGKLVVKGKTVRPNLKVVLEGRFEATSDDGKQFVFRRVYHPRDCVIELKQGKRSRRALVENWRVSPAKEAQEACGALSGPPGRRAKLGVTAPMVRTVRTVRPASMVSVATWVLMGCLVVPAHSPIFARFLTPVVGGMAGSRPRSRPYLVPSYVPCRKLSMVQ